MTNNTNKIDYKLETTLLHAENRAAYNSTFAIGVVSCSLDSFVVAECSVLRTNFCAEKPAHSKSANRREEILRKANSNAFGNNNKISSSGKTLNNF